METLAKMLSEARKQKEMVIREVSQECGIDAALISKFEKGHRIPKEENLVALARVLDLPLATLRKTWLAEKIYQILEYEEHAHEVLELAESRVEYLTSKQALAIEALSPEITEKLEVLDQLKEAWFHKKPLNQTQLHKLKEYFNIAYTFESNRIEGNTLTLQETHLVVNEGITIGGKSMREHLEAVNHSEAIDYIEGLVKSEIDFSKRVLLDLHYLILKGIDKDNAGRYRKVPVRISGSSHVPPQPYLLEKLMEEYFIHYENNKNKLHPVILATEMHERLVSIHPFIDGNGRTSRLVMNLLLMKHGFSLANLKGDLNSKLQYYKALEEVQVNNNPEVFYHLVIDAVRSSLESHLEMAG
ncbi:Fic family protein [Belliella marina]|uniref:Fic family protein n=1 Tax=Belliella marina TaxID=1644146 RepID=A0ABW4VSR5_9BACT